MTVNVHSDHAITDYVPSTTGLIDEVGSAYSVDGDRIFVTGQFMSIMSFHESTA